MKLLRQEEVDGQEIVELAALADGSISPGQRAALQERLAASSELANRLAEQERAVACAHGAAAEVEAPARLRARIEAPRPARHARAPRRFALIGAAVAATAAGAAAVALGLGVFESGTSSEHLQAALASTELASAAQGNATLSKSSSGWRIELHATGLPRLADGRFYEAWLRNAAGVLVPVGTFNEGKKVTLWAGVPPKDFSTLTVTREHTDGNQTSSGQKVLVGRVDTGG